MKNVSFSYVAPDCKGYIYFRADDGINGPHIMLPGRWCWGNHDHGRKLESALIQSFRASGIMTDLDKDLDALTHTSGKNQWIAKSGPIRAEEHKGYTILHWQSADYGRDNYIFWLAVYDFIEKNRDYCEFSSQYATAHAENMSELEGLREKDPHNMMARAARMISKNPGTTAASASSSSSMSSAATIPVAVAVSSAESIPVAVATVVGSVTNAPATVSSTVTPSIGTRFEREMELCMSTSSAKNATKNTQPGP